MKKTQSRIVLIAASFAAATFLACDQTNPEDETSANYLSAIEIVAPRDTMIFTAGAPTTELTLFGSFVSITTSVVSNTGALQRAEFVVENYDTSFTTIRNEDAAWSSSNASVATVVAGRVTPFSPGEAIILARAKTDDGAGRNASDSIVALVESPNSAPTVILDDPPSRIIFENRAIISGAAQVIHAGGENTRLRIEAPDDGYVASANYDGDGNFAHTLVGLTEGVRKIRVVAEHPSNPDLKTTKSVEVDYRTYENGALEGEYRGEAAGLPLSFSVRFDSRFPIFVVEEGDIDVAFQVLGVLETIPFEGYVDDDGSLRMSSTYQYGDFTVTGEFDGYFPDETTCLGDFVFKSSRTGWPTLRVEGSWSAAR